MPAPLHAAATREIKVGTRWPQLIATNGKVFRNVKFTFVSPREVRFMHTDGIGSLSVTDVVVPDDVELPMPGQDMPPELTMGPLGSMMTPQERKVSGIDKLSNDEQATLAQWVRNTVQDQLKEELERRGLPPTFAPLPPLAAEGAAAAANAAGLAPAPASPSSLAAPGSTGSLALPGSSTTMLMAAAPGKTYVPPPAPSTLLPPPGAAATPLVHGPATSSSAPAAPTQAKSRAATQAQTQTRFSGGVVESTIEGEFHGLEAGKQYRLVNGQTWVQQEAFEHDHLAYKPRVTIYPASNGWMMAVDGVDKAVRVAPVE